MLLKSFVVYLAILSLSSINNTIAGEHTHDSAAKDQVEVIHLNNGSKWVIDKSLHTGMTNIKLALERNISLIHYKKFTASEYVILAKEVDTQIHYLFENCKLPKDADEQLHTLLFSIIKGSEKMKSSENQRIGAIEIIKTLHQYPQFFNDVNWQPLKH